MQKTPSLITPYVLIFALFIAVLILGSFEALVLSPEDYKQSDSVRIMYVHVPAAWISLGIFSVISILSFGVLIFGRYLSCINALTIFKI